jgi:citrate lyase subunit beta/citryl-CoA lyase
MTDIPPRLRSVLYMPGANERALQKARDLPADALILDLEDAVAPDAKVSARERVCAAAHDYPGKLVAIRANAIGTAWHDEDVAAAAAAGPDAILIPKVSSAQEVLDVEFAMDSAGAPPETKLWAMLETPLAALHAYEICSASARLTVLVMGTNDLLKELYAVAVPDRAPLVTALKLCLLGARAAGKQIVDGVYNDVKDLEGFAAECRQGRELGFDGKTLIHPGQVEICNRVFSPSEAEIEHSRRVIEAWERADSGVVTLDGRMIENLHVETARRILALAD